MAPPSNIDDQSDDFGSTSSLLGSSSPSVGASSPVIPGPDTALILTRFGYTLSEECVSCADCGFVSNSKKDISLDHMKFDNRCSVAQCHFIYCLLRYLELFRSTPNVYRISVLEYASLMAMDLKECPYRYERKRFDSLKVGNILQASLLAKDGWYLRTPGEIACYACDVRVYSSLPFQDQLASHDDTCPFKLGLAFNVPRTPVPRYEPLYPLKQAFRESGIQWKDEEISRYAPAGFSYVHNFFNQPVIMCEICGLKMDLEVVPEDADLMLEHASSNPTCAFVEARLSPAEVVLMNLRLKKQGRPFLDIIVVDLRKKLEEDPITQCLSKELLNFLASMTKEM